MATTQEIKAAKRAELDTLAVAEGLDPAEYSKVEDLRTALLPKASDASEQTPEDGDDNGEGDGDGNGDQTQPVTAKAPVNEAEQAADKAEEAKVVKTDVAPQGHAAKFDKTGQPVFGKAK